MGSKTTECDVVVFSPSDDLNDDQLFLKLTDRGINALRFVADADDHAMQYDYQTHEWRLSTPVASATSQSTKVVWFRHTPDRYIFADEIAKLAADIERRLVFRTFLELLPDQLVINPVRRIDGALNKVRQAHAARDCGLTTPATILQSGPLRTGGTHHVIKRLSGGLYEQASKRVRYFPTTRLSDVPKNVRDAAGIVQEEINRIADVRLFVIGDKAVGVRFTKRSGASYHVDYRANDHHSYIITRDPTPDVTVAFAIDFNKHLRINASAMDFLIAHDGTYYFLEANIVGNWIWYEHVSGLDLTTLLADLCIQRAGLCH